MKLIKQFIKNNSGVAAIEMALILPFLLLILYGVFQISNYISFNRRMDGVVNDMAYLLSRQSAIATTDVGGNFVGGQVQLRAIAQNIAPLLMYPFRYDPSPAGNSQLQVMFVGLPSNFPLGGTCPSGFDATQLRILWADRFPSTTSGLTTNVGNNDILGSTTAGCPFGSATCPVSCTGTFFRSSFVDSSGRTRATIVQQGQSVILVNLRMKYVSILGDFGTGIILPNELEKLASYTTRSSWNDLTFLDTRRNNRVVDFGEFQNNMQYCTDCLYNSCYSGITGVCTNTNMAPFNGNIPRQNCAVTTPIATNLQHSGGCSFL